MRLIKLRSRTILLARSHHRALGDLIFISIKLNFSSEIEKKDLEESQDASGKGPDIIPLSKDPEGRLKNLYLNSVFFPRALQPQIPLSLSGLVG